MRQGWTELRIGDLGKIVTGKTPSTTHPSYFGDKYPFITPTDMDGRKSADTTQRYLSDEGAVLQKTLLIPENSISVSCIGWQMGKVIMTSRPSFTNQQLNTIIPNEKVNANYLYYSLSVRKDEFLSLGSAAGVRTPILNKSAFSELKISLPPLPAQRRIADILSAYDDLIENNTRRIRILEQMARAIYQEWFGKVDKESLPKGWQTTILSNVADVNSTSIKNGNEPEEINYVDIASVSTGKIDAIQPMKFSEAPGRARRIVRHGDVIWSTVRPNRKSYSLIIKPPDNMIVSTGFAVLRAKTVPFSYLYLATTTEDFAGYLTNHATGSAYPAVNSSDFENAEIVLPREDLLNRFDSIVSPMFILRETLLAKNANLRQTRDLLLPRLVGGEIDV